MEGTDLSMSRVLFLRVSAKTYDETEVPATWPMLYAAVWPDGELAWEDSPAKLARGLAPRYDHGVLELADALVEAARFADASDRLSSLKNGAQTLERLRGELDDALGDRNVAGAQKLCDAIEEALDGLEKTLRASSRV
jgi:hypothetical protein